MTPLHRPSLTWSVADTTTSHSDDFLFLLSSLIHHQDSTDISERHLYANKEPKINKQKALQR